MAWKRSSVRSDQVHQINQQVRRRVAFRAGGSVTGICHASAMRPDASAEPGSRRSTVKSPLVRPYFVRVFRGLRHERRWVRLQSRGKPSRPFSVLHMALRSGARPPKRSRLPRSLDSPYLPTYSGSMVTPNRLGSRTCRKQRCAQGQSGTCEP